MLHRIATWLLVASCVGAALYLTWNGNETRRLIRERFDQLDLTQNRDNHIEVRFTMATQYETTIDCCGDPLTITTTGGTITEHLEAVAAAKKACQETCK